MRNITVWLKGQEIVGGAFVAPHKLVLPDDCERWEIVEDSMHTVKFLAVNTRGGVQAMHAYPLGSWCKYEATE